MTQYPEPSEKQKEKFHGVAGKIFPGKHQGRFRTKKPHNRPSISPYVVLYQYHPDTGYLFINLTHPMAKVYSCGWDQKGEFLPQELVFEIYPNELDFGS